MVLNGANDPPQTHASVHFYGVQQNWALDHQNRTSQGKQEPAEDF